MRLCIKIVYSEVVSVLLFIDLYFGVVMLYSIKPYGNKPYKEVQQATHYILHY